jgi:hypothetical protein
MQTDPRFVLINFFLLLIKFIEKCINRYVSILDEERWTFRNSASQMPSATGFHLNVIMKGDTPISIPFDFFCLIILLEEKDIAGPFYTRPILGYPFVPRRRAPLSNAPP